MYGEYKKYITIMGLVKPVLRLIQGKIFPGMSANSFSTFEKFSAHYSFPRTSQRTGFPLFHTRNLQPPARPEHAIFNGSRDASESEAFRRSRVFPREASPEYKRYILKNAENQFIDSIIY